MENSGPRDIPGPSYISSADPGMVGGGTYTAPNQQQAIPTLQDYENIFGPAGRDVKQDLQRNKRHARWHLPDALKGVNPWLTDRVDGLITDTTSSPFTTVILPYKYIDQVDAKIKWNVWSFDEGLASRVPYESAARTLTQTKRSYAGYTVRQGLAITMEHNFMMSEAGRTNFQNQLKQVVGSIQYTNDIDVHVALITAPSYAKHMAEKYYTSNKTNHQLIREYVDLFGFMAKNPNAMDIMIEEAKSIMRQWGSQDPTFLLTNSRLTFQMTMLPEKTQYLTQGIDGLKRLRTGPDIKTYRGLSIINSRMMSLEDGAPPRDILRRRVRVAEYNRIPYETGIELKSFAFYDEAKDSWQKFTWLQLYNMSKLDSVDESTLSPGPGRSVPLVFTVSAVPHDATIGADKPGLETVRDYVNSIAKYNKPNHLTAAEINTLVAALETVIQNRRTSATAPIAALYSAKSDMYCVTRIVRLLIQKHHTMIPTGGNLLLLSKIIHGVAWTNPKQRLTELIPCEIAFVDPAVAHMDLVIIRPNIEHNMLGIVMGRGGLEDLGATLWGQTELSVYDDSMHGIWGMSYKYNERAIVYKEKNLIRLWDVAYDGYNGGKDCTYVNWTDKHAIESFHADTYDMTKPYEGQSMMVMSMPVAEDSAPWPSPIVFYDNVLGGDVHMPLDAEHVNSIDTKNLRVFNRPEYHERYSHYHGKMPKFDKMHNNKQAGASSQENETSSCSLAFQGSMKVYQNGVPLFEESGNGHHGPDYVGAASVRSGKGVRPSPDSITNARIM